MTEKLLVIGKALLALARAAGGHIQRLLAERAAAGRSPGTPHLMEDVLLATFKRLTRGQVEDASWQRVLDAAGHAYVTPDFLKKPALQRWLRIDAVQEGFMALAKAKISGAVADNEQDIRYRLGACYADVTGEAEHFAELPTEKVLDILIAGYIAAIPGNERPAAGMTQYGFQRIEAKLDDVTRWPRSDPFVQRVHDKEAQNELSDILTQRMFDPGLATERIQALHRQTEDGGELAGATDALKNRVRYWTARFCARTTEGLAIAQRIRDGLPEGQTGESLLVVDAWIAATSGDGDKAMQLIRDADDPDCRTVFFSLLARLRGEEEALAWCMDVDPTDQPTHFTHVGWGNWGLHVAKAGRWEDAARGLLETEQQDVRATQLRRLEARLGKDPDEIPPEQIRSAIDAALDMGPDAVDELAADAGASGTAAVPSTKELVATAKDVGSDARPQDAAELHAHQDLYAPADNMPVLRPLLGALVSMQRTRYGDKRRWEGNRSTTNV